LPTISFTLQRHPERFTLYTVHQQGEYCVHRFLHTYFINGTVHWLVDWGPRYDPESTDPARKRYSWEPDDQVSCDELKLKLTEHLQLIERHLVIARSMSQQPSTSAEVSEQPSEDLQVGEPLLMGASNDVPLQDSTEAVEEVTSDEQVSVEPTMEAAVPVPPNEQAISIPSPRHFVCLYCSKHFTAKWNLVEHLRVHNCEKPFVCPICKGCFRQKVKHATHNLPHQYASWLSI